VRLSQPKISEIENNDRCVEIDELVAIAGALQIPPIELLLPSEEEKPVRMTHGLACLRGEVANWLVYGPPWTENAKGAVQLMRATLDLLFWHRARTDDPLNQQLLETLAEHMKRLMAIAGIEPGVMKTIVLKQQRAFLRRVRCCQRRKNAPAALRRTMRCDRALL
jgi:hypothetical protein